MRYVRLHPAEYARLTDRLEELERKEKILDSLAEAIDELPEVAAAIIRSVIN